MSMNDWTKQERDVGILIMDMFEEKDPTGQIEFNPIDIYASSYGERFEYLWPDNNSIIVTITKKCASLKKKKELIQPKGRFYPYKLSQKGCLFLHLSLRVRHKEAEQAVKNGETLPVSV